MNAIDIHTHIVPAEFPAYAGKHVSEFGGKQWPQMCATATALAAERALTPQP